MEFIYNPLEHQTTIYKWMFGETTIFYIKIWNHPIETTIYKWLIGVPGLRITGKPVFLLDELNPPPAVRGSPASPYWQSCLSETSGNLPPLSDQRMSPNLTHSPRDTWLQSHPNQNPLCVRRKVREKIAAPGVSKVSPSRLKARFNNKNHHTLGKKVQTSLQLFAYSTSILFTENWLLSGSCFKNGAEYDAKRSNYRTCHR